MYRSRSGDSHLFHGHVSEVAKKGTHLSRELLWREADHASATKKLPLSLLFWLKSNVANAQSIGPAVDHVGCLAHFPPMFQMGSCLQDPDSVAASLQERNCTFS